MSMAFHKRTPRVFGGLLLFGVLLHPWVRAFLEAVPSTHMLLQLPLLVISGFMMAAGLSRKWQRRFGVNGLGPVSQLLLAIFILLYWMVPRALDAALEDGMVESWKFISLPFLCGVPLRLSWRHVVPVARGFVMAQLIAMLAFLGWLYAASPVRICNNYLASDQQTLGWCLLAIATLLAWALGLRFLVGMPQKGGQPPSYSSQSSRSLANVC